MTAEVAVMNKNGISLAADSAVTIGNFNKERVYNSANKLFMLSKYRPIAVMVYGNAAINGMPWEIVIKEYRRQLGERKYDALADYARDFIEYITKSLFDLQRQVKWFVSQTEETCKYVVSEIDKAVKAKLQSGREIQIPEIEALVDVVVGEAIGFIETARELSGDYSKCVDISALSLKCDEVLDRVMQKIPMTAETKNRLRVALVNWHNKDVFIPESGIVIAGFGEKEFYPVLHEYIIEGVIPGFIKCKKSSEHIISDENSSLILPFAQRDAVMTFCKGVDPELEKTIGASIGRMLAEGYPDKVIGVLKELGVTIDEAIVLERLKNLGSGCLRGIGESVEEYKHKHFIGPLVNTASMLPLDEMSLMAETFVNLSSLRKRFTSQTETVGGPIDVCVISKYDGFIWMKRKHYFDQKLNHHFQSNYYR